MSLGPLGERQEIAETAMNELLGWYGYGKVDRADTLRLSLHRFTNHSPPPRSHSPLEGMNLHSPTQIGRHSPPLSPSSRSLVNHHSDVDLDHDDPDTSDSEAEGPSAKSLRSLSPSKTDQGSGSSRGSTPKSENGCGLGPNSGSGVVLCAWCGRVCTSGGKRGGSAFQLPTTSGDRHFCSEVCFTQCRRASFKKSKVCDWCRHVRPTVTYVDFTDGDHQLQFCSDKCLNQYKMQIFCRETEAHLQMHPHLNDLKPASNSQSSLITPDLWMRDCESAHSDMTNATHQESEDMDRKSANVSPSLSMASSLPSPNPSEPVNLTTSASGVAKSEVSPSLPRPRPTTPNSPSILSPVTACSPSPVTAPRYGRPRLRDRKPSGKDSGRSRTLKTVLQHNRGNSFSEDNKPDEQTLRLPTIRVRHLEDPLQQQPAAQLDTQTTHLDQIDQNTTSVNVVDINRDTCSPLQPALPPGLSLGGLRGILPMVGGAPIPLPHLLPPDIQRQSLLPHLLLQHPELLRPPHLRPPIIPPPPPSVSVPPTNVPPPPPPVAPQSNPSKPPGSLIPPVTVLLPCPLPIPIPIPIPIPVPIPNSAFNDLINSSSSSSNQPCSEPPTGIRSNRSSAPRRENTIRPNSVIAGPVKVGIPVTIAPQSIPTTSASSSDAETPPVNRPDRERRSILRYTSDVYEVNGMFLPRESTWDAEPVQLRRALVGLDRNGDSINKSTRTPSPVLSLHDDQIDSKEGLIKELEEKNDERDNGDNENVTDNEKNSSSNNRKRHSSSESSQSLPKKKHLLV